MVMELQAYLERKGRGATAALARELGVPHVYVWRWARGQAKPEGEHLASIVRATGLRLEQVRPDLAPALQAQRAARPASAAP